MATASVRYGSILERNKWVFEKLDELKSQSFCAPYIGNSFSSVVQQVTDISKKAGHEVRFQFDGNLISAPVVGSETAFGKGESKRVFSDSVRVNRVRFPVDNGDKFDAASIDSTYLTEHDHSMSLLADKWIRFKDQAILDVAQQSATHRIVIEDKLDLTAMGKIKTILTSGIGYVSMNAKGTAAPRRRPLAPYKLANGEYVYLFLVDSFIAHKFLTDSQAVLAQADVRGADNMLIKGVIGKIHNMLIVEAPVFFGESKNSIAAGDFVSANGYANLGNTDIEVAGLRQFFSADGDTIQGWSGQSNLVTNPQPMWSRGVILGAGAIHYANGLEPRYSVKFSQDFDITSQSCLETWCGFRAVKLLDENGDYPTKLAGVSHGIIAVDIKLADNITPFSLGVNAVTKTKKTSTL